MQKARLIVQKNLKACQNMAIDESLIEYALLKPDDFKPVLRLYTWQPAGISLGYFQKLEKEINIEACKKYGVDIVRRPTGGKAVLHDDELTYCFIFKMDNPDDWTILDSFKKINEALLYGIRHMGIDCELVPYKKQTSASHTAVCFAAPTSYEIKINDKKVIGSAQMRRGSFILQHGSVPITLDRGKLYNLFNFKSEEEKLRQMEYSKNIMTALKETGVEGINFNALAENIKTGFENAWNLEFFEDKLNKEEEEIKNKLEKYKYSTDDWNYKRKMVGTSS